MAIDQNAQYPIGTAAPTADYPEGSAINETVLDALDGFPWEKEGINDRFGFEQALLRVMGVAASGSADTALVSQYLQGVIELASGRAFTYDDGGAVDAYVLDLRTGQQFAPGLFIGQAVKFPPANTSTGAATLDYGGTIDALVDRAGNALTGGELVAGIEATAVFDGTDWRLTTNAEVDALTHTITHEMTVDAAYTLTVDENRSGRIVVTDTVVTLTGAVNVVVADIKRVFFARNDTAEILTFKTSAGTGVAINAGAERQLLCNGTDVIEPVAAPVLNTKVMDIGDWDMSSATGSASVNIAHGLTKSKIRNVSAMVRSDTAQGETHYNFERFDFTETTFHQISVTSTNVILARGDGGNFDGTAFDQTSFNRGWITIQYTD